MKTKKLLFAVMAALPAMAEEVFDYDVTKDGKGIVINRYKGLATSVTIPAVCRYKN